MYSNKWYRYYLKQREKYINEGYTPFEATKLAYQDLKIYRKEL